MKSQKTKKMDIYDKLIEEHYGRGFSPKVTYNQLYTDSRIIVGSWGAHEFQSVYGKALIFKVNGAIFKGTVFITLAYDDTYTVCLISEGVEVGEAKKGVYCDELTNTIDLLVETPS